MSACAVSTTGGGAGGGAGGGGSGSGSGSGSDNTQPTYPTDHPRIYLGANKTRLQGALAAGAPSATRIHTMVDNWLAGADYWGFSPANAALFGQLTGDAKYCTKAIAEIENQVTTAETTIASGNRPDVTLDSYLHIGDMIGDLALVYDWCHDTVTADQQTRWLAYANQAVYNIWHHDQAQWAGQPFPWNGWATDDPVSNYYFSFLRATMLLGLAEKGEDPNGDTWIAQFHDTKLTDELFPTFDADLVGGASREGTGYGVSMRELFQLYDMWKATTGETLAIKTPHTRASLLAYMHQIVPTLDRLAPTGDHSRESTGALFDYDRQYIEELVYEFKADPLAPRAQQLLASSSVPQMVNAFMAVDDFLYDNSDVAPSSLDGGTAYYAPGIGQLYARSGWDTHATWMNLIAGPYTEVHAHQDQGSLLIYKDGWLAYDPIVDSHTGIRPETGAHNIVRILNNGAAVPQIMNTTSQLVALHAGPGWLYSAADVTAAYNGNAAVSKVQREIVYLQPDTIVVYDRVTSASGTQQVWSMAMPKQPTISGATATMTGAHALHVQRLAPATTANVFDYAAQDPSGDYITGYRLEEPVAGGDQRFLHVISIDGAVASTSSANDSTVTVTLANQQTATIAFSHDAIGATLTFGGSTTTLTAGVDSLPE